MSSANRHEKFNCKQTPPTLENFMLNRDSFAANGVVSEERRRDSRLIMIESIGDHGQESWQDDDDDYSSSLSSVDHNYNQKQHR